MAYTYKSTSMNNVSIKIVALETMHCEKVHGKTREFYSQKVKGYLKGDPDKKVFTFEQNSSFEPKMYQHVKAGTEFQAIAQMLTVAESEDGKRYATVNMTGCKF